MKTLHLIRHAKSNWDNPKLADIERTLNQRGQKSCQLMAKEILKAGCDFSNVYCSIATRAQQTIQGIQVALPNTEFEWTLDKTLYTFSSSQLLSWCRNINDDLDSVVVVGHNPAITELCNKLSDHTIDNVPTCAYVQLQFPGKSWADLQFASTSLTAFITPKLFRGS